MWISLELYTHEQSFCCKLFDFYVNASNTNKMRPERKRRKIVGEKELMLGIWTCSPIQLSQLYIITIFLPFIKPRTHQSVYLNSFLRSLENPVKAFWFRRGKKKNWMLSSAVSSSFNFRFSGVASTCCNFLLQCSFESQPVCKCIEQHLGGELLESCCSHDSHSFHMVVSFLLFRDMEPVIHTVNTIQSQRMTVYQH